MAPFLVHCLGRNVLRIPEIKVTSLKGNQAGMIPKARGLGKNDVEGISPLSLGVADYKQLCYACGNDQDEVGRFIN